MTDLITVSQLAAEAGVLPAYVRAEIAAGKLTASKLGSAWVIRREDAQRWLDNPRRGSRSKADEPGKL